VSVLTITTEEWLKRPVYRKRIGFTVEDIVFNWQSGDFVPPNYRDCPCTSFYHNKCQPPDAMQLVMSEKRNKPHYQQLKRSLVENGFVIPITARRHGKNIVLMDGHTRLAAAAELEMLVNVIVFSQHSWWESLVSRDSGSRWNGEIEDLIRHLPWYEEYEVVM
jgi:hypothetical protein